MAGDILDLFFGSFLDRTFGEETRRGLGWGTAFDVAKRANRGGGAAGGGGGGDDGPSLVFLRRKAAILLPESGGQKQHVFSFYTRLVPHKQMDISGLNPGNLGNPTARI